MFTGFDPSLHLASVILSGEMYGIETKGVARVGDSHPPDPHIFGQPPAFPPIGHVMVITFLKTQ